MTQRQINAAYARSLKTVYKHLNPVEYRLVKLHEKAEGNDKSIGNIERYNLRNYGADWRRNPEAPDVDLFFQLCAENLRITERISRIEDKHGIERECVIAKHTDFNRAAHYHGSF
jgi:hypothetical protein